MTRYFCLSENFRNFLKEGIRNKFPTAQLVSRSNWERIISKLNGDFLAMALNGNANEVLLFLDYYATPSGLFRNKDANNRRNTKVGIPKSIFRDALQYGNHFESCNHPEKHFSAVRYKVSEATLTQLLWTIFGEYLPEYEAGNPKREEFMKLPFAIHCEWVGREAPIAGNSDLNFSRRVSKNGLILADELYWQRKVEISKPKLEKFKTAFYNFDLPQSSPFWPRFIKSQGPYPFDSNPILTQYFQRQDPDDQTQIPCLFYMAGKSEGKSTWLWNLAFQFSKECFPIIVTEGRMNVTCIKEALKWIPSLLQRGLKVALLLDEPDDLDEEECEKIKLSLLDLLVQISEPGKLVFIGTITRSQFPLRNFLELNFDFKIERFSFSMSPKKEFASLHNYEGEIREYGQPSFWDLNPSCSNFTRSDDSIWKDHASKAEMIYAWVAFLNVAGFQPTTSFLIEILDQNDFTEAMLIQKIQEVETIISLQSDNTVKLLNFRNGKNFLLNWKMGKNQIHSLIGRLTKIGLNGELEMASDVLSVFERPRLNRALNHVGMEVEAFQKILRPFLNSLLVKRGNESTEIEERITTLLAQMPKE